MKRARGRPRQFERETALDAAMMLFWERGYEGTSIDDLTDRMGLNRPSLYGSFGSKEQLFCEAIERYSRVEGEPVDRAMQMAPDSRGAVEAMLRTNAEAYCSKDKPGGCMIVLSAIAGTPQSHTVRQALSTLRKNDLLLLERRLQQGKDLGEFGEGVEVADLARFYITVLQGLSIQAKDGATLDELNAVISAAMHVWPPAA